MTDEVQTGKLEESSRSRRGAYSLLAGAAATAAEHAVFSPLMADPTDTAVTQKYCHRFVGVELIHPYRTK